MRAPPGQWLFLMSIVALVGGCGSNLNASGPCDTNMRNTTSSACPQPVYDNIDSPCYRCVIGINCLSYGGVCFSDTSIPCVCNYGFTNANCSEPIGKKTTLLRGETKNPLLSRPWRSWLQLLGLFSRSCV